MASVFSRLATRKGRYAPAVAGVLCAACLAVILGLAAGGAFASTAHASAGKRTVSIGFITDKTGDVAFAGTSYADGVQLAVRQVNATSYLGKGVSLSLDQVEGASDPATSVQLGRQLMADPHVLGVICCILTPIAGSLAQLAESTHTPLDIYGASGSGLAHPPYVYRTVAPLNPSDTALSAGVIKKYHPQSVLFIDTSDDSALAQQVTSYAEPYSKAGIKNLGTLATLSTETDFSGVVSQAIADNPDVITISALPTTEGSVIKELRQEGYSGVIVANSTISITGIYQSFGSVLAGVPFNDWFSGVETLKAAQPFIRAFKKTYGSLPDTFAAQGYTAGWFFAAGLRAAGSSPTRARLTRALSALRSVPNAPYGSAKISKGQVLTKPAIFAQWSTSGSLATWTP